ncbi:MAG TPA: chlorite dismutase family protein [Verrucomicrobiae bacterium]|nr:chlorite dismutase family protein [Verrucomicrobiae bacterium]
MEAKVNEETLDISEKGLAPQTSDQRLYMQFLAFGGAADTQALRKALEARGLEAVLYEDLNDPRGVGLLFMNENPDFFIREIRPLLAAAPFAPLTPKPELTMFGRTYALGRETDLKDWLFEKPRRNALNPEWPWAIWYPLRRRSEFELLPREEQGKILYEHAKIGMAYGRADYAHDIRLACYGLDRADNEFVIGLVGRELFPLSKIVQDMRKTQQTAKYIQSLGPFFVGKAVWQSARRA